jgi:large subunit ribosomal protein L13
MKTYIAKKADAALNKKRWYFVDAKGQILGRLAAKVATVIRGKHNPKYTPHCDMGDFVVVVNAQKIRVTGRKLKQKQYLNFSGYPGGLKRTSLEVMLQTKPIEVIRSAVRKMLPAGPLHRDMLKKLKIYAAEVHPHTKVDFIKLNLQ